MVDAKRQIVAVDVGALPPEAFDWSAIENGCDITSLTTRLVSAPPFGRSAILSWRWDRDLYSGRSRNVALALAHARSIGLETLFFDVVSIDQSLVGDALIDQVIALSEVYSEIDVIAAYDRADVCNLRRTLLRPWIFSEQKAYAVGRRKITYVGFQNGIDADRHHAFANELHDVRNRGAAPNVLGVMVGEIGMSNPKDFSLILPALRTVLQRLYRQLPLNDYLMSTFVLVARLERESYFRRRGELSRAIGYELNFHRGNFDEMKFARFSVGRTRSPSAYQYETDIFFDQTLVAVWSADESTNRERQWVSVERDADQVILEGMDFSRSDIDTYRSKLTSHNAGTESSSGNPSVRELVANIPERKWQPPPQPRYKTRGFNPEAWQ